MAYANDLLNGSVISVELSAPTAADKPDAAQQKLSRLEQRLARFTAGGLYVNITDGLLGQRGTDRAKLIEAMRSFRHDRSHVILNLSCNHPPDEAKKIVYAALLAGYSQFLLVPGDLLNGSRPIGNTVDLAKLVKEAADGAQLFLGASLNPHSSQFPQQTLPRLYHDFGVSFLQTQPVSVGDIDDVKRAQCFLSQFGVNVPVAYGVLRGDREGKILGHAKQFKMPVPADVQAAYKNSLSQKEAVALTMAGLHQRRITNFLLMNAAHVAGEIIQNYMNLIGKV